MRKKGGRKKKHMRAAGRWQGLIAVRVGRASVLQLRRGEEGRGEKGEGEQCEERRGREKVDSVRRGVEEGRGWTV